MHDITFAKSMVLAIEKKQKELADKAKITAINVKLSPLSHVNPKSLESAFRLQSQGKAFETITLNIRINGIKITCKDCKKVFLAKKPAVACQNCKSGNIEIDPAEEFIIESVEAEAA